MLSLPLLSRLAVRRQASLIGLCLAASLLASCATPETRVRTALTNAGVSPRVAECMADRMVDRLSLGQLRRLSSLGQLKETRVGNLTLTEFLRKTRALQDTEILGVVSSSGLICWVGG